jgi:hypothetical protein
MASLAERLDRICPSDLQKSRTSADFCFSLPHAAVPHIRRPPLADLLGTARFTPRTRPVIDIVWHVLMVVLYQLDSIDRASLFFPVSLSRLSSIALAEVFRCSTSETVSDHHSTTVIVMMERTQDTPPEKLLRNFCSVWQVPNLGRDRYE